MKRLFILIFCTLFALNVYCQEQERYVVSDTLEVLFKNDTLNFDERAKKKVEEIFDGKTVSTVLLFGYGDFRDQIIMEKYKARFALIESYISGDLHQSSLFIQEVIKVEGVSFQESEKVTIILYYEKVKDISAFKMINDANATFDIASGSIVLSGLTFYPGRHYPIENSLPVLDTLLATMIRYPDLKISIEGHICCVKKNTVDGLDIDTGEHNLSEMRAMYVYNFLIANGIKADRMAYIGFGARKRVVKKEKTSEDEALNRRVEIRVVNPGALDLTEN